MTAASFAAYSIKDASRPAIALVTGGRSGIGKAIAKKIATFPFIDNVLIVSRSVQESEVAAEDSKFVAVAADIGTAEGRRQVVDKVASLSQENGGRQLRYLIHSAGTIDPIKSVLGVQPEELRNGLSVNLEGPFFLSTALYPYMKAPDDRAAAGRILHVSSGAAHGAPPVGWGVYGITKAAFFQSFRVLSREFEHLGGKVVVGSFKPGIVDTSMQGVIRDAPADTMPMVGNFKEMKEKSMEYSKTSTGVSEARPPPKGALDSPDNVAFFAEWLLLGTSDEEFSNRSDDNEYDIRDAKLFAKWIPEENRTTQ